MWAPGMRRRHHVLGHVAEAGIVDRPPRLGSGHADPARGPVVEDLERRVAGEERHARVARRGQRVGPPFADEARRLHDLRGRHPSCAKGEPTPGRDPLPGDAALPRAPAVPGPELSDSARGFGHPCRAVGAGQRCRARLHGRVGRGDLALRGACGRAGARDRGRRHALVWRRQCRRAPHGLRAHVRRRGRVRVLHARRPARRRRPSRGVEYLPKGSPIDAVEMDAICAAEGVTVEPWDVVVIRTGYMSL